MTNSERAMIRHICRIYAALTAIPLPQGYGTSTASVSGVSGYVRDMREATPLVAAALRGVATGDDDAERDVRALELWVAARKAEDWR